MLHLLMRTTLDIDLDALAAAKEIASRTKKTAGQVVSDLIRQALSFSRDEMSQAEVVNGFEQLPDDGRVVTPELVAKLIDESETS